MNEDLKKYDLDLMWKHQLAIDRFLEIIEMLKDDKDYYIITNFIFKLKQRIVELQDEITRLKGYIDCDHSDFKTVGDGYDSHNNYYREVCSKCGRTLKSYRI